MMRSLFTLAATLLLAAAPAAAQDVLPQEISSVEQFSFTGTVGSTSQGAGAIVGPYRGVMESMPGRPTITLYCVDFLHGISTGDGTITANMTGIGSDGADLGTTRAGLDPDGALNTAYGSDLIRYRRAAFLSSIFETAGTDPSSDWGGIHAAIWTVMSPGYTIPSSTTSAQAAAWIEVTTDALNGIDRGYGTFDTFDFSEWTVMTDVRADDNGAVASADQPGVQEYLVRTTVTPEPETVVLLVSGLLILGVFGRRRLGALESESG